MVTYRLRVLMWPDPVRTVASALAAASGARYCSKLSFMRIKVCLIQAPVQENQVSAASTGPERRILPPRCPNVFSSACCSSKVFSGGTLSQESRRSSLSSFVKGLPASTLCPTVALDDLPLRFFGKFGSLVEVDRVGKRPLGTPYPSFDIVMLICVCKC